MKENSSKLLSFCSNNLSNNSINLILRGKRVVKENKFRDYEALVKSCFHHENRALEHHLLDETLLLSMEALSNEKSDFEEAYNIILHNSVDNISMLVSLVTDYHELGQAFKDYSKERLKEFTK